MTEILNALIDAVLDTLKMAPILFLAYLFLEWAEHRGGERLAAALQKTRKAGPLLGAAAGLLPQCGFSGAAANFYASGTITAGTLLAVFLSTSDEMLPMFLSARADWRIVGGLLVCKLLLGLLAGFVTDRLLRLFPAQEPRDMEDMCRREGCDCERHGIFRSALRHTVRILGLVAAVSLGLNLLFVFFPAQALGALWRIPVLGPLTAAILGLVPNCSASVLLTRLYLEGVMGFGPLLAGLSANAGAGLLVLFRVNRRKKENALFAAALVFWGVLAGCVAGLFA